MGGPAQYEPNGNHPKRTPQAGQTKRTIPTRPTQSHHHPTHPIPPPAVQSRGPNPAQHMRARSKSTSGAQMCKSCADAHFTHEERHTTVPRFLQILTVPRYLQLLCDPRNGDPRELPPPRLLHVPLPQPHAPQQLPRAPLQRLYAPEPRPHDSRHQPSGTH